MGLTGDNIPGLADDLVTPQDKGVGYFFCWVAGGGLVTDAAGGVGGATPMDDLDDDPGMTSGPDLGGFFIWPTAPDCKFTY
jgi:hypothetical protein